MNPVLLGEVERFVAPRGVVDRTDTALRAAGERGAELFVLWTGRIDGATFTAQTAYVPDQTAHRLSGGVCVTVEGDALHTLNQWLYHHGQTLGVQIHTHPTRAYHSTTDDTYPIVTQRGGLSIVVPDFAERGMRGSGVAVYRLGQRGWRRQRTRRARRLVQLDRGAEETGLRP